MLAKRAFDIIMSALGLVILSPLLLLIAILVFLDSPGPVFYRGLRTGLGGKPFRIFKFRTMLVNAGMLGGSSTAKDDPRVTRVGRFLRRHKLDELPQLLNVLIGDMSIVGPRPEFEEFTSLYTKEEQIILTVRPGITDYSSITFIDLDKVLGSENADEVYKQKVLAEKNRLRVRYVKERTLLGDMQIILLTLAKLVRR